MLNRRQFIKNTSALVPSVIALPYMKLITPKPKTLLERLKNAETITHESFTLEETLILPNADFLLYKCHFLLLNDAYISFEHPKGCIAFCVLETVEPKWKHTFSNLRLTPKGGNLCISQDHGCHHQKSLEPST